MSVSETKPKESQRKQVRYPVSDDARVRASIVIRSSDASTAGKDWTGTLVDVSAGGAHIQISLGAVAYQGDRCQLKLTIGTRKIELWGTLAHYVCSARISVCGVKFDAALDKLDPNYQLLLKAVVASTPLKGGPVDSDSPGRYKEEYAGPGFSKLVVWRDNKPERGIIGFDYTMARYAAMLPTASANMFENKQQVTFRTAPNDNGGLGAPITPQLLEDARWEFNFAASNLPKTIPADIRRFLRLVS